MFNTEFIGGNNICQARLFLGCTAHWSAYTAPYRWVCFYHELIKKSVCKPVHSTKCGSLGLWEAPEQNLKFDLGVWGEPLEPRYPYSFTCKPLNLWKYGPIWREFFCRKWFSYSEISCEKQSIVISIPVGLNMYVTPPPPPW